MDPQSNDEIRLFEKGSIVGKDPENVQREHEKFKKRVSGPLKRAKSLASSKRDLLQQIREAGDEDPSARDAGALAVRQFMNSAGTRDILAEERSRGIGADVQRGLYAVSRFAAAYSSILDAVSSASGPYAEVGWQTMSILLIIVVNKTKNDNKLEDHMDHIEKLLPRLGQWKEIYRDREIGTDMQKLVADAYHQVIDFSRAVAEYCCHFWTKRLLPAIFAATLDFDVIAKNIYRLLAEINATANLGLHARAQKIDSQLGHLVSKAGEAEDRARKAEEDHKKLLEDNKALQARLDKQERQEDERRFHLLQKMLDVTMGHPGLSLSSFKSSLQVAFPDVDEYDPHDPYSTYLHMTPPTILSHPTFVAWADAPSSSLLFIHGNTQTDGRATRSFPASWLSPAAIHLSEFFSSRGERSPGGGEEDVAFFSCRPDADHLETRAEEVLAATALKLVSMRKEMLRDHLEDFGQTLRARDTQPLLRGHSSQFLDAPFLPPYPANLGGVPPRSSSPLAYGPWSLPTPQGSVVGDGYDRTATSGLHPTLQQLTELILAVLEQLQMGSGDGRSGLLTTTKYIILDRLDSANGVRIQEIMNELARLVGQSRCRVKVVAVVEMSHVEGSWRVQDVPRHLVPPGRLFEVHMNQRQLDVKTKKRPHIWSGFQEG